MAEISKTIGLNNPLKNLYLSITEMSTVFLIIKADCIVIALLMVLIERAKEIADTYHSMTCTHSTDH